MPLIGVGKKGEAFNMRELRRIWEHAKPVSANSPKALHHAADEELLRRQLRFDIGQLNAESPPEAVTAIVDRIAACATDGIMREALLKTVKAQTDTSVASMRAHIEQTAKAARKQLIRSIQDWRDKLSRNHDGEPLATAANVLIALRGAPQWRGVIALNEFNQRPMLIGRPPWANKWDQPRPFSDADEARALVWVQQNGMPLCRIDAVRQALAVAIDDNRFHPVRDYLDSLVWDGRPRLDNWMTSYLGVNAIENYTSPVGRCWLISGVARIYQPGCQAKYCLVLEGVQDLGKSTALEVLGGEWYTDDIAEIGTKDSAMQAGNAWIVELAELDSIRRAHVSAVKAFISRKADRFRKHFGRYIISQARQCILAATINPGAEYLADETCNVRFWPVLCININIDALQRDRNQLWAEARDRYRDGEKWYLTDEDAVEAASLEQETRQHFDSWTDVITQYLKDKPNIKVITTTKILKDILFVDYKDQDKARTTRVGIIMRKKLKWLGGHDGSRRWFYHPDATNTDYPAD
jgi:predicted P-loop ATPase